MKKISLGILSSLLVVTSSFSATLGEKIKNNSLIVYNNNMALVHEERDLSVNKNDKEIVYRGVANTIDTDSVNVELPDFISLYSQQYRFDKLSQQKLLDEYIGKEVTIRVQKDDKSFKKIKATLLNSSSYPIVKTKDGDIISVAKGDIIFHAIPNQLITKPSLVWNISSKKSLNSKMKIDYIIKNINYKSNYILNIKKDVANLKGWISIQNRSGKRFEHTKLYVLAGKINTKQTQRNIYRVAKSMTMDSAKDVTQQAHEGYHFYTIPFKVDIANNETTQIKFIDKKNIPIERKYTTTLSNPSYFNSEIKHDVTQYIQLAKLDFALPKGVVRSYSKLKNTTILLGETDIGHTPKKAPINLRLGTNFDIKVTESIQRRDDTRQYRDATIKYTIHNSSKDLKKVQLLIPFNKNSSSSIETKTAYKFTKGKMVTFNISVKGGSFKSFSVKYRNKI
jgi:hypothetical protein